MYAILILQKGVYVMKKNIPLKSIAYFSIAMAYSPVISMESLKKSDPNPLEQSQVMTVIPTTSGLGIWRSAWNLVKAEEENFYQDLANDNYNPENASHPRLLDKTLELFTTKQNDKRVTDTIFVCREKYSAVVTIKHSSACMAHKFLVAQQAAREERLTKTLHDEDKNNRKRTNDILELIKQTLGSQITILSKESINQHQEQQATIETESDEIRRLKKGRLLLRKLSGKNNTIPGDEYCSDEDEKSPETAISEYTNDHILQKLYIDTQLDETKKSTQSILTKLATLYEEIEGIQEIPL